jgi:hypothetical protein
VLAEVQGSPRSEEKEDEEDKLDAQKAPRGVASVAADGVELKHLCRAE